MSGIGFWQQVRPEDSQNKKNTSLGVCVVQSFSVAENFVEGNAEKHEKLAIQIQP